MVPDRAQARDAGTLRGVQAVVQVDQLGAFDPVHAPVVDTVAAGPRAGLGRHGGTHGR